MRCCGTDYQTITVRTGGSAVALLRCSVCDDQRWSLDGALLGREAAFAHLATAYREVPLRARQARDRAAAASAARSAARAAERARAVADRAPAETTGPARPELQELLSGWSVLGAAS